MIGHWMRGRLSRFMQSCILLIGAALLVPGCSTPIGVVRGTLRIFTTL